MPSKKGRAKPAADAKFEAMLQAEAAEGNVSSADSNASEESESRPSPTGLRTPSPARSRSAEPPVQPSSSKGPKSNNHKGSSPGPGPVLATPQTGRSCRSRGRSPPQARTAKQKQAERSSAQKGALREKKIEQLGGADASVKCSHCKEDVAAKDAVTRGRTWCCRPCNSSRNAIERSYNREGKRGLWQKMGRAEKNRLIVENKGKSSGRGRKFPLKLTEQVAREDSIALRSEKQWLNAREWRRKSKKKWGLTRAESNARWRSFLEDVSIPKGLDQEGWVTMPALTLLTTAAERKVAHRQALTKQEVKAVKDDEVYEVAKGLKTGTLHKETSIFDRSSLNDFLESSCLEVESAMRPAPAGKAKAKSKAKARAKSSADPGSIDPEERPKRVRHKDAERDVARIAALRARRGAVAGIATSLDETLLDLGNALLLVAEPDSARMSELKENVELALKQMSRVLIHLPEELADKCDLMIETQGNEGQDETPEQKCDKRRQVMALKTTKDFMNSLKENTPCLTRSPCSNDIWTKAWENDDALDEKCVKRYVKSINSLMAAAQVAVQGLQAALDELSARESEEQQQLVEIEVADDSGSGSSGSESEDLPSGGDASGGGGGAAALQDAEADFANGCAIIIDGLGGVIGNKDIVDKFAEFAEAASASAPMVSKYIAKLDPTQIASVAQVFGDDSTAAASNPLLNWLFWGNGLPLPQIVSQHRLCCVRYQIGQVRFQQTGCNEALLAKVIANVDGVRFVAGMSYERISTYSSKLPKPQSFLGCTQQLADMRPDEFFGLGGFAVALKPEQTLLVPAGSICLECPLMPFNSIVYASVIPGPDPVCDVSKAASEAAKSLQNDLTVSEEAQDSPFVSYVSRTLEHVNLGVPLAEWVKSCSAKEKETDRASAQKEKEEQARQAPAGGREEKPVPEPSISSPKPPVHEQAPAGGDEEEKPVPEPSISSPKPPVQEQAPAGGEKPETSMTKNKEHTPEPQDAEKAEDQQEEEQKECKDGKDGASASKPAEPEPASEALGIKEELAAADPPRPPRQEDVLEFARQAPMIIDSSDDDGMDDADDATKALNELKASEVQVPAQAHDEMEDEADEATKALNELKASVSAEGAASSAAVAAGLFESVSVSVSEQATVAAAVGGSGDVAPTVPASELATATATVAVVDSEAEEDGAAAEPAAAAAKGKPCPLWTTARKPSNDKGDKKKTTAQAKAKTAAAAAAESKRKTPAKRGASTSGARTSRAKR